MNNVQKIFDKYGITPAECQKRGLSYQTFWCQLKGLRALGPKSAIKLEKAFGVPRWESCPDYWDKPSCDA